MAEYRGIGDPQDPLLALLHAKVAAAPTSQQFIHRAPDLSAGPLTGAISPFVSELFGINPNVGTTSVTTGAKDSQGQPIDLTDPAVHPGDAKLTPMDYFVRYSRRLARSIRGATTGLLSPAGVTQEEMRGNLAAPMDDKERLIDQVAPMLAAMGVLAPAGPLAGLAEAGPEAAMAGAAGQEALLSGAGKVAQAAPKYTIGGFLSTVLKGGATGAVAGAPFGALGGFAEGQLPGEEGQTAELMKRGAIDMAQLGFKLGATTSGLGYAGIALFTKLFDHPNLTPLQRAQVGVIMNAMDQGDMSAINIGPGTVIDGKQAVMTKSGLAWRRWNEKEERWDETVAPSEQSIKNYQKDLITKTQQGVDASKEGQALNEAAKQIDPLHPETLPMDIRSQQQRAITIGADYFNKRGDALVDQLNQGPAITPDGKHLGEMLLKAQLQQTQDMLLDPTLSAEERITAAGRVMALQKVLREQESTLAGLPSMDTEVAAINFVRSVPGPFGLDVADRLAAELETDGQMALGQRIRELGRTGIPEAMHKEITDRLDQFNKAKYKGVRRGSRMLGPDGHTYRVLDKPGYGLVAIEDQTVEKPQLQWVDASKLQPIPKAGKTVRTTDGKILDVNGVDAARGIVDTIDPKTGQKAPISLGDIKEISDDPATQAQHDFEKAFEKKVPGPMQEVPPTKAATSTGEPVTITASNENSVGVKTRKGGEKVLPREEVARSSANKPGLNPEIIQKAFDIGTKGTGRNPYRAETPAYDAFEAGKLAKDFDEDTKKAVGARVLRSLNERYGEVPQTVTFHKGEVPEQGNKILFFRVPKDNAQEFDQLHAAGQLDEGQLKRLVTDRATPKGKLVMTPHVLPPEPMGQHAIYGVELPASVAPMNKYSDLAKTAIKALKGETTVGGYFSPVDIHPADFAKGRFYRVPDEMMAAIQQPKDMLQFMDQDEHTSYLRNLINMNEQVNHEYAQAATASRQAHNKAATAFEQNDGNSFSDAEAERAEAMKDAADAFVNDEFNSAFIKQTEQNVEQVIADNDDDAALRAAFEQQGVTQQTRPFWYRSLAELPPAPYGSMPDEYNVAPSKTVDGQRLRIYSRTIPSVERTERGLQPSARKEYELVPIDAQGNIQREAVRRVNSEAEVEQFLDANGYAKTLLKQFSAQFEHKSKPGWVVSVRFDPGTQGYKALGQQRVEVPTPHEMEQGGEAYSPTEQKIVAQLAKKGILASPGETVFIPQGNLKFDSMAEAEEGLAQLGYERSGDKHDVSLTKRFKELPPTDVIRAIGEGRQKTTINATKVTTRTSKKTGKVFRSEEPITREARPEEALELIEARLENIARDAVRMQAHVPDPIVEYAYEFSKVFDKIMDRPPFSRDIREALALPSQEDLGPQPMRSIDLSNALLPNVPYQKGYMAPSPRVPRLGDQPGVYSVGDHLDIQHVMHLTGSDEFIRLPMESTEPRTLYASVLRGPDEGPTFANLKPAVLAAKQQAYLNKATEAYNKAVDDAQAPQQFTGAVNSLGTYKSTGQPVMILSVDPAGGEMMIQSPDNTVRSVDPSLVEPANAKTAPELGRHYSLAGLVMEGRFDQLFRREPPVGFGSVEKQLGMLGVTDRMMLNQAIASKAYEYANQLWRTGLTLEGPQEAVNGLLDMYNRGGWIKGETPIPLAQKGIILDPQQHVINAIRSVDPELEKPFRYAAYRRARAVLNDSPYADLRAKVAAASYRGEAAAGLLDEEQTKALEEWRRKLELSPNLPPERVVDELVTRRLLNQHVARMAQSMRNVMGFLGWADAAELPGEVKIRMPDDHNNQFWPTWASIPWKMFRRHPMTMMLQNTIQMAQTQEQLYVRGFKDMMTDVLQQAKGQIRLGYNSEDSQALRKALQTYNTLDEAQKGGLDPKYHYAFDKIRGFLDNAKYDHIRYFLQRQINPVEVTQDQLTSNRKLRMFLEKQGINTKNTIDGFMVLSKHPEEDAGITGEERSTWTHDKIEGYISMLKRYDSAADLPEGTDPDYVKDFDFWKRYGRKNYYPHIHQGSILVTVQRGGTEKAIAWAPSMYDALQAHRALIEKGKIAPTENVSYSAHKVWEADDVLARSMLKMKRRDWDRFTRLMSENVENEGEEVKAMLLRQYGPRQPPLATQGTLVSAKPRSADLEPVFPDLSQDLMHYTTRIARNQFQWNVSKAAQRFLYNPRLDESLARKFNQPQLSEMPKLQEAAKDYVRRAVGEYTKADAVADNIHMMYRWASEAPTEFASWMAGKSPMPIEDIINPLTYKVKYGGRGLASNTIAFQAFRKLMANPMSALVNYLQYQMNTVPLMLGEGENPVKAVARAEKAWADGHRMWYANTFGSELPEQYKGIYPLLKEIGVDLVPTKDIAGGGFGNIVGSKPEIIGKTKGQYAGDLIKWAGMLPFNGGEQIGRFATAIGAIQRQLEKEGIDWKDAKAIEDNPAAAQRASVMAQKMVEKTFFKYDDLGMPSFFSQFGPLGRLAFQFKPFIYQQMSYEKDLLMDMLKGTPGAAAKFGGHMAITSVLGGLTGLAYHPVLSTIGGLIHLVTNRNIMSVMGHNIALTPEAYEAQIAHRRELTADPEQTWANTPNYKWDDMLYYGLPGLFHVAMGDRIGISGQDVMPDFNNGLGGLMQSAAGPTFGMVSPFIKAWTSYAQTSGSKRGILGGLAGAVAMQQLTRAIGGGAPMTFSGIVGGIAGGSLFSRGEGQHSLAEFLNTSKEGRELLMQITSGELRNAMRTWEIMQHGYIRNMDGEREYFPASTLQEEVLAQAFGANTINREEYHSVMALEASENARVQHDEQSTVKEIATALAENDQERAWDLEIKAQGRGIVITPNMIQDELETLTNEAMNTMIKKKSVMTRWLAPGENSEPLPEEKPAEGEAPPEE
jgi:hypothetical protein